jgi:uncharacterized protein YunC (DUF1805 family)
MDNAIKVLQIQEDDMDHKIVQLNSKQADGYVLPLGPVSLVIVVTDLGMVGCGAFDVAALNNFGYPAARVRPAKGGLISSIDDLLEGVIKEANPTAEKLGVRIGMTGLDGLDLLN